MDRCTGYLELNKKFIIMETKNFKIFTPKFIFLFLLIINILPENSIAQYRPSLFFREDWKEISFGIPVTQGHVQNENLILNL